MKGIYLAAFKAIHPGYFVKDLQNLSRSDRQGGYNVQQVIERWLDTLKYYI